jgi:hypothetical protein
MWLTGILVALVLYILSPPPLARLLAAIYGPNFPDHVDERAMYIYLPLAFVAERVPAVEEFYLWYFKWWGVEF